MKVELTEKQWEMVILGLCEYSSTCDVSVFHDMQECINRILTATNLDWPYK